MIPATLQPCTTSSLEHKADMKVSPLQDDETAELPEAVAGANSRGLSVLLGRLAGVLQTGPGHTTSPAVV